ncbi:MAG: hypothetical protein ABF296_00035 [Oceanococcaceae bacterium]
MTGSALSSPTEAVPGLRLLAVHGPAWVQDLGRTGHMGEGMPWGGALIPAAALASNTALGNPPASALIEFVGRLRVQCDRALAVDGEMLAPAAVYDIEPPRRRRAGYLAVAGGLAVPLFMGGRGTLPTVGIGGWEGRTLRRGDVLPLGEPVAEPSPCGARARVRVPAVGGTVVLWPGPHGGDFTAASRTALLRGPWRVDEPSDRTGIRLRGPRLVAPSATARSQPMVRGAIQVPPQGPPVVLGPDHPVTGGYPVIAVVCSDDLGRVWGARAGEELTFVWARTPG